VIERASVHGRFQPFHNEHMEYVLEALRRSNYLWIGITKYDVNPTDYNPLGREREKPENNPLTYFERVNIISEALVETGVSKDRFGFVPFPIETPKRLLSFMPTSILCYTTICEPWNEEKIKVLTEVGYTVEVLWRRKHKGVTGSDIRDAIVAGLNTWHQMVPPSTIRAARDLRLAERLAALRHLSGSQE
jgi:nicotinamide mononucleotide adenylyltransferase